MLFNRKLIITVGLLSIVTLVALTSMAPDKPKRNLKVLPKDITDQQLDHLMDEWEHSLGARCSTCHVRDEKTRKTDFASDAKPEKEMARKMYKMMNKINQKYFDAKKDSLGMMAKTGINCYTCHNGVLHPEVKLPAPPQRRPQGGTPPAGTPPGGATVSPPKQ